LNIKFDYVKHEDIKRKYLSSEETFAVPSNNTIARITITGIPPEYSGLGILANIDRILGFPDYLAEKPITK